MGQRGDGGVGVRVLEGDGEGAWPPMESVMDLREVAGRLASIARGLLGDVAVHFVVGGPRLGGGVDVETGAGAQVVGVVLSGDVGAAGSVGEDHLMP